MCSMKKDDSSEDFGALLEEFDKKGGGARGRRAPEVGQLVRGRVISVGREAVFIAIEGNTRPAIEGMLDLAELLDEQGNLSVKEGDVVEARVVEIGDKSDHVILRRTMMRKGPEARAELQQAFELGIPVEGTVTGVNKGGVDVTVAGVRGFCPISQLELRGVEDSSVYIGRKLNFKITRHEVDRRGVNLVLSRRALLEADAQVRAAETRSKIAVGSVVSGVVTAVREFGAFVDLGGLEGMLPASELGFSRGQRPSEVLSVGQPLQVQILEIKKTDDPKRPERISLSLKALERDPWEDAVARFPPGTKVVGRVTNVESFGAFVELAPGVEGLVHVGELSGGRQVRHARELVKVGDEREVTVLAIERDRRRISLGVGDRHDVVDPEDLARAASPGKLGTLGDLLRNRKP
jgi:small subunit ribosomal protein S1